jgi:RNA polymerase sigma-70 factor, ECF subfamily
MTTIGKRGHGVAMSVANPPLPMDSCEDNAVTRGKEASGHVMRFYGIYRDHVDYVWRLVFLLGLPRTDVDDAVQEVFMVIHRRLDEFAPPGPPRQWIRSVAVHVCRNHQRWRRRLRRWFVDCGTDSDLVFQHADRTSDATFSRSEDLAILDRALRQLTSKQREVFIMSEIEQLTAAEIGEILTISPNTASSRLRAARHAINQFVDSELNSERGR